MEKNYIINDQYKIKKKIGSGGFAITYLAEDLKTEQLCTVKHLSLKKVDRWKSIELFKREAKILKNIDHPQIPDFIDFITIDTEEDTKLYLVQEYYEGKNLQQLVNEGRHFTEKEVIQIALEIVKILEYLHGFSPPIIHRDIKPSNILFPMKNTIIKITGKIYLIDFGAVRDTLLKAELGGSTIIGTFGYMPFEQFEGRAFPSSDIYSLGITLIFLLSHKAPANIEKEKLHLNYRPYVKISRDFIKIIDRMIEPDWKDRYQTASDLKKDLEFLIAGKSIIPITKKNIYEKKRKKLSIIIISIITIAFALFFLPSLINKISQNIRNEKQKNEMHEKQIEEYISIAPSGRANFDYSNNDGRYIIGESPFVFETKWSKASDRSIHTYKNPPSIVGVALAYGLSDKTEIVDASSYDMSSRVRTPQEGEYVILKNKNGYFAVIKILNVKDRTRSDNKDELSFEYWIQTDKTSNFSKIK